MTDAITETIDRKHYAYLVSLMVLLVPLLTACTSDKQALVPVATYQSQPVVADPIWVILFDRDSAALTANGLQIVDELVLAAIGGDWQEIELIGHSDAAGPKDYNQALSLRRAEAVRDALVSAGVNPLIISVEGRGEIDLAVPTADGVPSPGSRRVVITMY